MQLPAAKLPRAVPLQRFRPPQENIPRTRADRAGLKRLVEAYLRQVNPVPPLSFEELRRHCRRIIELHHVEPRFSDYICILINNEIWRDALAPVPYERRLLLLPKCLRPEDRCRAPFDEFGLLCQQCGSCSIYDLQSEAERLGYAVLVAEGSAVVMSMIQARKIDAIVGVSCLSVLEKAFPYMELAGIPGMAIPLLQNDCRSTTVDLDWVWDTIHLSSADKTRRLDLDALRTQVEDWFAPESLATILGPGDSATERVARSWLGKAGKRWRPFLVACSYKALCGDPDAALPDDLRRLAIAVECFHKASLVHDDIEDNDASRYGEKTLHEEHGVPVALNVGDLLVGEGYRLIGDCDAPAESRARMLRIAAAGHRTLSLGQGAELCWARNPAPLSSLEVLDIFRQKTAPAFEVALRLGAACAGTDHIVAPVLSRYSEALGIAYQIRDDLDDLAAGEGDDVSAMRPSLPLALAFERSKGDDRTLLESIWRRQASPDVAVRARIIIAELNIETRCRRLLESYKQEAIRSLADLENASLKGLLRRVIGKIFSVEIEGWCSEFEAGHASGRSAGAEIAG